MIKVVVNIVCILIVLGFSSKYSLFILQSTNNITTVKTDIEKDKSEKSETSEEENSIKEKLKISDFFNSEQAYLFSMLISKTVFTYYNSSIPFIYNKIQKLPPKVFYS
ncbi:hypothetical protein [Pedobacter mucosus]|uniref:hypothetical protein n=1 Tax=Pedobacter mucosus TaxID=2895286 RepID=UPI001EE4972B|nr:hypothetical protein [Pedobacter mucosus]UKT65622.1 hypothetical protein LOK61_07480 [Pedobacter mucosus]